MKLTGHRSVSSLLALLLTASTYGLTLIMIVTAGLAVVSMFVDIHGATLDIPVSLTI